jgi:hypothetical protein
MEGGLHLGQPMSCGSSGVCGVGFEGEGSTLGSGWCHGTSVACVVWGWLVSRPVWCGVEGEGSTFKLDS